MTDFFSRMPGPIRVALDKVGEKDDELKRHIVGLDYALTRNFSDAALKILLQDFLTYVDQKYFIQRNRLESKVVFFLADKREKKHR
jgi:hypothetical protein